MDVGESSVASAAGSVFRETVDIQKQNIEKLVESVEQTAPPPSAGSSSVEQMGQNIDVKA